MNLLSRQCGFPPIVPRRARVLILGSMPSPASLAAGRYYAHPRNAFWRIIADLTGDCVDKQGYFTADKRTQAQGRCAIWDVFAACRRAGAADSAILRDSEELNDIPGLLAAHPHIIAVATNGGKAGETLRRQFPDIVWQKQVFFLPSTSPANARQSYADKLAAWRTIQEYLRKL